jgi:hypothetical protein
MVRITITVEATDLSVAIIAAQDVLSRVARGERSGEPEYVSQIDEARSYATFTVEETGPDNT